jgi:hypothetical protein
MGLSAERVPVVDPHVLICVVLPWVHGRLRREVLPMQRGSFSWTHSPHRLGSHALIPIVRYSIDKSTKKCQNTFETIASEFDRTLSLELKFPALGRDMEIRKIFTIYATTINTS